MRIHAGMLLAAAIILSATTIAHAAPVSTNTDKRDKAVRTLDAIHIEGEIAVPNVLFITSRDVPRFRDHLNLMFRRSAADLLRSADEPTRLRVVAQSETNKETGR